MTKRCRTSRHLRTAAIAVSCLALLLGYGCGGGSSPGEEPASVSVQMSETAAALSISTQQPARSGHTRFEVQALNFTFAAQVTSGPHLDTAIKGRLELKGGREDDGVMAVEGRLYPDVDPALPTPRDLADKFNADRKALKSALREDIKVLGEELRAALAGGTPYRDALATFKAKFEQRMAQYRAALSALIAEFRAAIRNGRVGGEDDDARDARGFEVHGTIGPEGAVQLTIDLGDRGRITATGKLASDGSAQGDFTGPASGDQGIWTANASDPGQPPPPPTAGTYEAGLTKYMAMCSGCHSAGKVDTTGTAGNLAGEADDLVSDLGRIDPSMRGLVLTAQDILDLKAFLRAANAPPAPPPAGNCAAQTVTWSQGAATCNASYAGGASGTSAALSDLLAPTTGTATASCSNGTLTISAPVCNSAAPQPPPSPAPCAAQDVTWSQGTSTCNAAYAGGASGTNAALSDILGPTTGTALASCSNGAVTVSAPVCSTAAPPPPPPPAPCPAQDVTWSQGTATCNAAYAGGASGTSTALSDLLAPTTGTATASCTNGVVSVSAPVCSAAAPPPPAGTYAAGLAKYNAACAGCHRAGSVDPAGPFSDLRGRQNNVVANLGTLNPAMNGIVLTTQEILDLQAFLSQVQ